MNKLSKLRVSGSNIRRNFTGIFPLLFNNRIARLEEEPPFEDAPDTAIPFAPYYQQHIFPHVQEFEEKRVQALGTLRKRSLLVYPLCIAIALAGIIGLGMLADAGKLNGDAIEGIGTLCIFAIIGLITWANWPIQQYKSSVKEKIFPKIFAFFGKDFIYKETGSLTVEKLLVSGIIPSNYTESSVEDYVSGSYEGVSIELTEAKITRTTGSGKNRRTVTLFQGLFILLGMNKNFTGKTIVKRDRGMLGNWMHEKPYGLEKVALEDPEFEKLYEVFSNDQIESRYLLNPAFMERLSRLMEVAKSNGIQCSFYENRLLLMVSCPKDRFETSSIFIPATFTEDIHTILEEMKIIFDIINLLKLQERTGL